MVGSKWCQCKGSQVMGLKTFGLQLSHPSRKREGGGGSR